MGKFPSFSKYVKAQRAPLPDVSTFKVDLPGKTVIVIGANTGLGLEAARHFASLNPSRIILGCRNREKAQAAVQDIMSTTGHKSIESWEIDMSNFTSVVAFADKFKQDGATLDLLVMNAGVNLYHFTKTGDNWETSIQVNYLSTSLLILLLLPCLREASLTPPTPRIVIVSSEVHYLAKTRWDPKNPSILEKLNSEKTSVMSERYWLTKLFGVCFVQAMAARLPVPSPEAPNLIVTAVSPGWCNTGLHRHVKNTIRGRLLDFGGLFMGRTPEMGSRTLVWAALAHVQDAGAPLHGHYSANCQVEEESDYVLSKEGVEMREQLWKETVEVLNQIDPRIEGIIHEHLLPLRS